MEKNSKKRCDPGRVSRPRERAPRKNPKRDENLVKDKYQEICKLLEENRNKIERGELVVYLIDECHLLWGDLCGYVWGARDERLEVLMTNERERQTYYGVGNEPESIPARKPDAFRALNYQTKEFFVQEYEAGNSENTIRLIQQLYAQTPESRVLIIWDGASYHRSKEVKQY